MTDFEAGSRDGGLNLTPYLPRLLGRWQIANGLPSFWSRPFVGVTLLADISGFTTLSESMAPRGAEGAETLASILDRGFGAMVALIHDHGGDILRFAGDAPIVLWTAEDGDLREPVGRAVECGLGLQDLMRSGARVAELGLSMRIGIGAGRLWAASVGGVEDRWEFTVLGEPLLAMGRAERRASAHEVVLSAEARSAVSGRYSWRGLDEGFAVILDRQGEGVKGAPPKGLGPAMGADPELAPEVQRPFVPRSLVRQLEAGHGDWLAEYRRVSVLFGSLQGLEMGDSGVAGTLDAAFKVLQGAVYEFGGSVNQFLVDDKGITLLALWGVPGSTHEDDARRTTEAALAMRRRIRRLGLRCDLGVTTGRVFCGRRGGRERAEYAVIGATVNLAARLMARARGEVLCDGTTAAKAGDRLDFERLAAVPLKGRSRLTELFRPLPPVSSRRLRSSSGDGEVTGELVGRGQDLERIDRKFEALEEGRGGIIEWVGPPGSGKSALLAELSRRAEERGLSVLRCRCDSIDRSRPYGVWASVVEIELELPEPSDAASRAERGRRVLQRFEELGLSPRLAPLLDPILELDLEPSEVVRRMGREVRRDAIRQLMLDWLVAGLPEGAVVSVDDAQWLDPASRALAVDIGLRAPHLLVVLAGRGMEAEETVEESVERWILSPLRPAALLQVVRRELSARRLPRELEDLLVGRAAGNPLFALEWVRALLSDEILGVENGVCRVLDHRALRAQRLPDSVQGIISSRMDRLDPGDQMVLKVGSVIGLRFPAAAVVGSHLVGIQAAPLASRLERLVRHRLLRLEDPSTQTYAFDHLAGRDAAYSLLLPAQRRLLHSKVATWYESLEGSPSPSLLAHHWSRAEDPEKSVHYLELAGEEAVESGAERQAAIFFQQALEVGERNSDLGLDPFRVVGWRRELGHALFAAGDMVGAEEHLGRALQEAGRPLPTRRMGWGLRLVREAATQLSHRVVPRLRRGPGPKRWALEAAKSMGLMGKLSFYRDAPFPFLVASLASVNLAETARRPQIAAGAYASLGYVAALLGLRRTAERWWQQSEASGDSRAAIDARISRGLFAFGECRWTDCDDHIALALQMAAETGDAFSRESALAVRVYRMHQTGRFEESLATGEELLESALSRRSAQREMWGRLSMIGDLLVLGRRAEASEELTMAADLLSEADDLSTLTFHGLRTRYFAATEDWRNLVTELERLRTLAQGTSAMSYAVAPMLVIQGETELLLWERAQTPEPEVALEFRRQLERTVKRLDRCARSFPYARLPALELKSDYYRVAGRGARASQTRDLALAEAERIGLRSRLALEKGSPRGRAAETD